MKKTLLLLLLATPAFMASAQDNKTPFLTKSLSASAVKDVFVRTSGGSITVSGATGQEPRIEVYINGNNGNNDLSKDEIQKRLEENYTLDIDVHDGELHATARNKRNNIDWRKSLSIGFRIYVNRQSATNLTTSGGSIHLDNLSGSQNFTTSGGSLHVDNVVGAIKGTTSGGSIHVSNSKQDIELVTSGGSISASNCDGRIRLVTSGGSLKLNDLKGTINASTSGGSISASDIDGELVTGTSGGSVNINNMSGSLDASTSAGSIHASMVKVGKYVKIDASSGHVDLRIPSSQGVDLDVRGDRVSYNGSNFQGEKDKERVVGKVNGGGSLVEVRGNGSVSVTQ
jgi:hypothetical protein